jgi:hypothetical protein
MSFVYGTHEKKISDEGKTVHVVFICIFVQKPVGADGVTPPSPLSN